MARLLYGYTGGDVIAAVSVDDGDLEPSTATFTAWTTRTGSTQVTDLTTPAGSATTTITPDADGRVLFFGPDGMTAGIWLRNEANTSGTRYLVNPTDLASRTGIDDHGALTGLGDDDHTQYYNQSRGDARYAQISTIIPKTLIDAEGDLIVGTANDTAGRLAKGTALQYLRRNAGNTANEWGALPAATAPSLDGLSDVTAASPADGALVRFDDDDGLWHAADASSVFAQIGADGRLAPTDYPQGFIPTQVVNPGGSLATWTQPGNLVWVRSVAATALFVDTVGTGNNATTASATVTATNSLTFSSGEYAVVCVSMSAETPATLPTISCTGPTNIGAMTLGPNTAQGSTVASYIFFGKATGPVPVSQTFTVTATGGTPTNRNDWAIRVLRVQGLVGSSPLDGSAAGGAANATAMTVATSGPTVQANEVAIACFGYNPVTAGTFTPTGGWNQIGTPVQNTDAGPRAVAVVYKILTASAVQTATGTLTNPAVYSVALAAFKGA